MSASTSEHIRLSVPARLTYRDAVGALLRSVCERLEQTQVARVGTAAQVLSAFNEAFNNLALHGWKGREPGACEIDIEIAPAKMVLKISDRGQGFDIEAAPLPNLEELEVAEGGYGLYIMRSFMSEVRYKRGAAGEANVLTMIRNLEADRNDSGPGEDRC